MCRCFDSSDGLCGSVAEDGSPFDKNVCRSFISRALTELHGQIGAAIQYVYHIHISLSNGILVCRSNSIELSWFTELYPNETIKQCYLLRFSPKQS